jgi:hypothetical protein
MKAFIALSALRPLSRQTRATLTAVALGAWTSLALAVPATLDDISPGGGTLGALLAWLQSWLGGAF